VQPPSRSNTVMSDEPPFKRSPVPASLVDALRQPLTRDAESSLKPGQEFQEGAGLPRMVVVPSGSFEMGSAPARDRESDPSERPEHGQAIKYAFAVGKYEVTLSEFELFAASNPQAVSDQGCDIWGTPAVMRNPAASFRDPGFPQGPAHPVVCVSWDVANRYIDWVNSQLRTRAYRLLSEAEWEFAARGIANATQGQSTRFWWGNEPKRSHANYGLDDCCSPKRTGSASFSLTERVGSYPVNGFGLADMHGNVAEWTADCWHADYAKKPDLVKQTGEPWNQSNDASSDCNFHSLRGGGWLYPSIAMRAAERDRGEHDARIAFVGFRLARTLRDR
jgi:formylglycine-generating enzyme required for sulfatase activity